MKLKKEQYPDKGRLNLPALDKEILKFWKDNDIFKKSISLREGSPAFVFYEGPPSANGQPGIHHVMARTIKDIFCRYKTLKGFQVHRKAGWDTHGLPIELNVEKELGITKDDIGTKISVEDYNKACRKAVMRFTDEWDKVTEDMGYWVDLDNPYITYENNYIESCWWILRQMFDKGLLYKGYTIQPFSPAAGTGLSSHELNQPGTYQKVKDTTIVAQFNIIKDDKSAFLFEGAKGDLGFLAWTTTPWTLPSNTALAVGKGIKYIQVNTTNPYTGKDISVIGAEGLMPGLLGAKDLDAAKGKIGGKEIEFEIVRRFKGTDVEGIRYEQLMPYVQPEGEAFRVLIGDFVTTEDGTGIVHLAPTFGADDARVAAQNDIKGILVDYPDGSKGPLVNRKGQFVKEMGEFAGMYVKNYNEADESDPNYRPTDVLLAIKLKEENKAFKVEKYEHDYPHCWRTDKPILYYPLDSWFIRTTAVKDRLIELNKTINWKPESTGTGRFGNWLENLVDWNLSRSRFWGIPLPIWATEDYSETKCIGSREELAKEAEKAIAAGLMTQQDWEEFLSKDDMHRPFVDRVVLLSDKGLPMKRETDLIDVWFDSGSMPYAQLHYPFENKELFETSYPADFIAEGVDQTRGWFFTMHAISTIIFDRVAYKNVVSNGLVLDKNGQKMSKRLGNAIAPAETLPVYGADATRWYMVGNAAPWDNLKFNMTYLKETQQSYFSTLYNTYIFFAQYANIDGFDYSGDRIPMAKRSELDCWIISKLNTLILEVDNALGEYEPHRGIKAMEAFLDELSNWYVRLSRRVFWKGEMSESKEAAYQTLYECLETLSKLMASYAPFFSDRLYQDLNKVSKREPHASVHLSDFPVAREDEINAELEERMALAREITSLGHSIRKNPQINIKVRQPLSRIMVPVLDEKMAKQVMATEEIVKSELNVKALELIRDNDGNNVIVKKAKANFKSLGPRLGQKMKFAAGAIAKFGANEINEITKNGVIEIDVDGEPFELRFEEVEIRTEDVPGWRVAGNEKVTVAMDLSLTEELKQEGLARELVSRLQGIRKESGLELTDRIKIQVSEALEWKEAFEANKDYICNETLCDQFEIIAGLSDGHAIEIEGVNGWIKLVK